MKLAEFTEPQLQAIRDMAQQASTPGNTSSADSRDPAILRTNAYPVISGDGAVGVPWCGMHVCIESDGHRHT